MAAASAAHTATTGGKGGGGGAGKIGHKLDLYSVDGGSGAAAKFEFSKSLLGGGAKGFQGAGGGGSLGQIKEANKSREQPGPSPSPSPTSSDGETKGAAKFGFAALEAKVLLRLLLLALLLLLLLLLRLLLLLPLPRPLLLLRLRLLPLTSSFSLFIPDDLRGRRKRHVREDQLDGRFRRQQGDFTCAGAGGRVRRGRTVQRDQHHHDGHVAQERGQWRLEH